MSVISYKGVAYKQSEDPNVPWIFSFVTSAEDLRQWVGIPRRAEGAEFGFQRIANDDRIRQTKEYFKLSGKNQSPTSIVIGIHDVGDSVASPIELQLEDTDEENLIRNAELKVDLGLVGLSFDDQKARIKEQITSRLSNSVNSNEEEEGDDELAELEEEIEDTEEIPGEIELGRSQIEKFLERLEDVAWCEDNKDGILEIAKPATVIDGQHRLLGAAACEREIPFTVCAIIDCPWEEQVYQFTVVNYTSSKIPDQFITANAALSLTKDELAQLENRLIQAGVKVVEYELMKVVNFDPRSPFYELINLTERKDNSKIGYKTMVRVAKSWYSGTNQAVKLILLNLYPELTRQRDRLEKWKEGDWGEFFLAFWKQVQVTYESEADYQDRPLMTVGTNLMVAIVLFELQEAFLSNLNAQDDDYFEPPNSVEPKDHLLSAVERRAEKVLEYLPAGFFGIEWGTSSLNTSAGRKALKGALRSLIDTKGRFGYQGCKLVVGDYENN